MDCMNNTKEKNEITYVLPTYNRTKYLNRCLEYFLLCNVQEKIIIVDSSDKIVKDLNRQIINKYNQLDIDYCPQFEPSLNPAKKIIYALNKVITEFVHFIADDDFIVFSKIPEMIYILSKNPGVGCCQGYEANVFVDLNLNRLFLHYGNHVSLEDESAYSRAQKGQKYGFTFFYSLYRTELISDVFDCIFKAGLIFGDGKNQSNLVEHAVYRIVLAKTVIKSFPEITYVRDAGSSSTWKASKSSDKNGIKLIYKKLFSWPWGVYKKINKQFMVYSNSFAIFELCKYELSGQSDAIEIASYIASEFAYSKTELPRRFKINDKSSKAIAKASMMVKILQKSILVEKVVFSSKLQPSGIENLDGTMHESEIIESVYFGFAQR